MSTKRQTAFVCFLGISLLISSCSTFVQAVPTATSIPPTKTPIPSPTTVPTPTAIPGSNNPVTVDDFKFQITEVQVADTIPNNSGGTVKIGKGSLMMTADGWVPQGLTPGDKVLTIVTALQSDNYQSFTAADLKIVQEDSPKSAIAVLTQDAGKVVIWAYDVTPSSNSFLFLFPDGVRIDLNPLMAGNTTGVTSSPTDASNWAVDFDYKIPVSLWSADTHQYTLTATCPSFPDLTGVFTHQFHVSDSTTLSSDPIYFRITGLYNYAGSGSFVETINPAQAIMAEYTIQNATRADLDRAIAECNVTIGWDGGSLQTLVPQKPYQQDTSTPTPTLMPATSCSVQNGQWVGNVARFTVDSCTITQASFIITGNHQRVTITLGKSFPIVNDGIQYSFTTQNTGLQSSQTDMEFSGTFTSPTGFKGVLRIPEGPVTLRASLQK